ncbi:MAG: hypothetical protein AAGA29_06290 [Planctomycetota bacterium]
MPVSGLVVTLAHPGTDAEAAAAWLQGHPSFTVGEPDPSSPRRLPVTLDTADRAEDKRLWKEMQDHPGIEFVDVACVFFEEEEEEALPAAQAGQESAAETTHTGSQPW